MDKCTFVQRLAEAISAQLDDDVDRVENIPGDSLLVYMTNGAIFRLVIKDAA